MAVTSLPPDCLLHCLELLDVCTLGRLESTARFWRDTVEALQVWQRISLAAWGTADLPLGCPTLRAAHGRRFRALRRLPAVLLAWGRSAAAVRHDRGYRTAAPEHAALSTRQLVEVAALVRRPLQAIAAGDPAVCVTHGGNGPFGIALPGLPFQEVESQQLFEAVLAAANHALWLQHEDALLGAWRALLDRSQPPLLEEGASLICRIAYPGLQFDAVAAKLQTIADQVAARLSTGGQLGTLPVLQELNHVLFTQLGFRRAAPGPGSAYHSYLCDVLDRKQGAIVPLAILYAAVARRLGVMLQGVDTGAYFLLCLADGDAEEGRKYIDVGNYGRLLTMDEVYGLTGENLVPAAPRLVFLRLLRDLADVFQPHDPPKRMLCLSQMALLMGLPGEQRHGRALAQYRMAGDASLF